MHGSGSGAAARCGPTTCASFLCPMPELAGLRSLDCPTLPLSFPAHCSTPPHPTHPHPLGGPPTPPTPHTTDIAGLEWSRISRGYMLGVRRSDGGPALYFTGFRDKDLEALRSISNQPITEQAVGVSGHNWGHVHIDGSSLVFHIAGKPSFHIPLPDAPRPQW